MLNVSQLNLSDCDSASFQVFLRPVSIPKKPAPRTTLRLPDSPGYAKRKDPKAALTSLKIFGFPLESRKVPLSGTLPVRTAAPSRSQFVGKKKPLPIL